MIRLSSIIFWFALIILASLGLYRTSDHVQALDRQMRDLNASISAEKQSIHVLNAEWVYLTNPERIADISHKHLTLRPTAPAQVATIDDLAEHIPTRAQAMEEAAAKAIKPVKTAVNLVHGKPAVKVAAIKNVAKTKAAIMTASLDVSHDMDSGHVRDHMLMVQRTASAEPLPGDRIGMLINEMNAGR